MIPAEAQPYSRKLGAQCKTFFSAELESTEGKCITVAIAFFNSGSSKATRVESIIDSNP